MRIRWYLIREHGEFELAQRVELVGAREGLCRALARRGTIRRRAQECRQAVLDVGQRRAQASDG